MEDRSKYINGKKIYAFRSKDEFLNFLTGKNGILIALNAEKLTKSDQELNRIVNQNIGYPDGIGAVWALKRKGLNAVKIAGAEFWLDVIERYQSEHSFYFLGSGQQVIDTTISRLKEQFPGIHITGYRSGYLESGDEQAILKHLTEQKPGVVFVAMGSPKQEFLMAKFLARHPALYMGLGGSFDVYSGIKKRAPRIFINLGLEWFYRLLKEPTRISRQLNLVKFLFRIIFDKI
ncbi:MAG: WecB/TagA/CpsF family glycosyltransferase [Chitinophagaceae bacterium]